MKNFSLQSKYLLNIRREVKPTCLRFPTAFFFSKLLPIKKLALVLVTIGSVENKSLKRSWVSITACCLDTHLRHTSLNLAQSCLLLLPAFPQFCDRFSFFLPPDWIRHWTLSILIVVMTTANISYTIVFIFDVLDQLTNDFYRRDLHPLR